MSPLPGIVLEPCNPYPIAPNFAAWDEHGRDNRHAHYLTQILDGLEAGEIKGIARRLALLHPRDFEQEMLFIQEGRERYR
jgi:hypothetical protein